MTLEEIAFKITDLESLQNKYENKLSQAYLKGERYYNLVYMRITPKLAKTLKKIKMYKKVLSTYKNIAVKNANSHLYYVRGCDLLSENLQKMKQLYALLSLVRHSRKTYNSSVKSNSQISRDFVTTKENILLCNVSQVLLSDSHNPLERESTLKQNIQVEYVSNLTSTKRNQYEQSQALKRVAASHRNDYHRILNLQKQESMVLTKAS